MNRLLSVIIALGLVVILTPIHAISATVSIDTGRAWIVEMKQAPRGPFRRLRWFCKDGTVHPPKPYPCAERGGGHQHGEWHDKTKQLRAAGYKIANRRFNNRCTATCATSRVSNARVRLV